SPHRLGLLRSRKTPQDLQRDHSLHYALYQTTSHALGNLYFFNITDLQADKVGFGSVVPGSKLESSYMKWVVSLPYNIS
ncbi:hypothetical protein Csa_019876, partial [Cucumis sativus]